MNVENSIIRESQINNTKHYRTDNIPKAKYVETAEEKKQYKFFVDDTEKNQQKFNNQISNKINTQKYTVLTFIPKALLYQFKRPANVYFLFTAILTCIPAISPLSPYTAIFPIIIVLSVSVIREGIEDWNRGSFDKQQNSEPCSVYKTKKWLDTTSGELNLGEICMVKKDEVFPADLILIDSALPEGVCFIETGSLDGEKTLKNKESPKQIAGSFNIDGNPVNDFKISGDVLADEPNPVLYQLNGRMHIKFTINQGVLEAYDIPLDSKQLLLKGAKLKNTPWIIGIIVYSGHNCKIMKNAKDSIPKYSSLEFLMNNCLIIIFSMLCILCLISAILSAVYYHSSNSDMVNVDPPGTDFGYLKYSLALESFLNFFTYLLLLNTLIPISLIITLEVVKLIQGAFIGCDWMGYSHLRQKYIQPNSVSLNEELGVVNYIFSDKTGTLTSNKMEFKFCVIGDVCYEYLRGHPDENSEKSKKLREDENIMTFNKFDMYDNVYNNMGSLTSSSYPGFIVTSEDGKETLNLEDGNKLTEQFWIALALCNSCSLQTNDDGSTEYICVSPDSIELCKSAKDQGWGLAEGASSSIKRILLGKDSDNYKDYERLNLLEFTSDRKRESVIIRTPEGQILLYCKGADSIIEERLHPNTRNEFLTQGKYYVDKFSTQGFRTLFIAVKVLSQSEYDNFLHAYNEANMSIEDKEQLVNDACELVENNLYLLGTTIVEDKLQENVPETIRDLRLADIKVWMLTGDKMNTAYNIGLSCNLISADMKTFNIRGIDVKKDEKLNVINQTEREQVIIDFCKDYQNFKGNYTTMQKPTFGILVDEKALLTINEDEKGELQRMFLDIAKDAAAVICCRVSPLQKSQVVKMMKKYDPSAVTLAIGDGGNDVSMIMEAHIGVGIYGEEGMRAVQSADYAIGEFQFLRTLLFFHGRTNYFRNAECIYYFFYKNFVFTLNQFLYGFYCNFTGQSVFDDWFISLFNLLFTSLPLGSRALLDHDIMPSDGKVIYKMMPFVYLEQRTHKKATFLRFILNLFKGVLHCLINFFGVVYALKNSIVDGDGNIAGLWFLATDLFTNVLIIITLDLIIHTRYHTWINWVILFVITVAAYVIFLWIVHNSTLFYSVATMVVAFGSYNLWLNLVLVCITCALLDYFIIAYNFLFNGNLLKTLRLLVKERGLVDEEVDLPRIVQEKLDVLYSIGNEEENNTNNSININNSNNNIKLEIKASNKFINRATNYRRNINVFELKKSNSYQVNNFMPIYQPRYFFNPSCKTINGIIVPAQVDTSTTNLAKHTTIIHPHIVPTIRTFSGYGKALSANQIHSQLHSQHNVVPNYHRNTYIHPTYTPSTNYYYI